MNRMPTLSTAMTLCLIASNASAADLILLGRASYSIGSYAGELAADQFDNAGQNNPDGTRDKIKTDGFIFGTDLGASLVISDASGGAVLTDLEFEYLSVGSGDSDVSGSISGRIDSPGFDRTDLKLTAGYQFPNRVAPIVGYRFAAQGSGVFSDDTYSETGYFVGLGYSGISLGETLSLSGSLAYNATTLDLGNGSDQDAEGASARLILNFNERPYSVSLRYQFFEIDEPGFGFDEGYLLASFTYNFLNRLLGQD